MIKIDFQKKINSPHGILNLDIKLEVEQEKLIAIVGESGVGKTTLLKVVSGLLNPDFGKIEIDDVLWFDS